MATARKQVEPSAAEQEIAKLKAELAAAQAEKEQRAAAPAPRNPAPQQQQQHQGNGGGNFRPNKMENYILGSLFEDSYGNLRGSMTFSEVKDALMKAVKDSKSDGRVRFQVLYTRKDHKPFLTVGGVGEFGSSGGGKSGGQRSQQRQENYDDNGADGAGYSDDNSGDAEWN